MPKSKGGKAGSTSDTPDTSKAMPGVNPDAMEAWQGVMTECNRFFMARLREDLETQKAMLRCTSPAELMQVQTEFYQSAVRQYSEEAMRLFQMMTDATTTSVRTDTRSNRRKYDDVPL